jgi:MFS family permease
MSRHDSVFDADKDITSFWGRMKVLWANSCFLYLVAAGALRFFGGYSLGFLSGNFFEKRYPDYVNQFAIMNAVVVIGGGLPASMMGGWLSDKYEDRYGNVKGLIAGCGALAATPFIVIAYTVQPGFWGSIISYYFAYFIAEMWYGPSHAQINNMFPSEYQGFAVSAFNFSGAIFGTIATLSLGALRTKFDTGDDEYNARVNGYILTGAVLFSYLTCGPLFLISGRKYAAQLEKNKKQLKVLQFSQIASRE